MFKMVHERSQGGFTIIEVAIAILLFAASVVGIAGMMVEGGKNINRGATENTATNLAAEKVEEVKSIPYYVPFDPETDDPEDNYDIDDYYYNTAVEEGNGVSGQPELHPQLDNPMLVEDYGEMKGYSKFKRTTAIEYQYVDIDGNSFTPAVMASDWVPKDLTGSRKDKPRGGDADGMNESIHAIVIEVCVYYQTENGERCYKQRGIAGDLMVTGGQNDPVLLVTRIDPTIGFTTDTSLSMKISVEAMGDLGPDSTLQVSLWHAGRQDIVATNAVANEYGDSITCEFDLTQEYIMPGEYSIAVYWLDEGFEDKSFRDCFLIKPPAPGISSVSQYDWGYSGQNDRQVTITGESLKNPTVVQLIYPDDPATEEINEGVTLNFSGVKSGSTDTKLITSFNLATVPDDPAYWGSANKWDIYVETWADEPVSLESVFLMNPPPVPGSLSVSTGNLDMSQTINVSGTYFQENATVRLVKDPNFEDGEMTNNPIYVELTGGTLAETYTSTTFNDMTANLLQANFKHWDGTDLVTGDSALGTYYLYVENVDGQAALGTATFEIGGSVPPDISSVTASGTVYYNDWDSVYITINGSDFNTDPGKMDVIMFNNTVDTEGNDSDYYSTTGVPTGGATSISNVYLNTIGLAAGTYDVKVIDTETGLEDTLNDCITVIEPTATGAEILVPGTTVPTSPFICSTDTSVWPQANPFWNNCGGTDSTIDTESNKNMVKDGAEREYHIIAKKMRSSNVMWQFRYIYSILGYYTSRYTTTCTIETDRLNRYARFIGVVTFGSAYGNYLMKVACSNDNGSNWPELTTQRLRMDD